MQLLTFLVVSAVFGLVSSAKLNAVQEIELNKFWNMRNQNKSIERQNLTIPAGVYSAFSESDPEAVLYSYNDVNMRWIAKDNWTFYITFSAPELYSTSQFVNLTFNGIDTISTITFNQQVLGQTDNMFVRYSYNVKDLIKPVNYLEVSIKSPIYVAAELSAKHNETPPECPPNPYNGECHMNFLRKMQASFGWDWGLAAPSMGIWKSVVLQMYNVSIIEDVDVSISKSTTEWNLLVRVFLETALKADFYGDLMVLFVDLLDEPLRLSFKDTPLSYKHPVLEFNKSIPVEKVKLWWPNGYGEQALYHMHFVWNSRNTGADGIEYKSISEKSIRIGFRTVELVQETVDTGRAFYFRINGVPIFMKGTNWIPSHILPELMDNHHKINHLLKSTKDAHMNMIRVWGGGVYESDYFYDMADYYGILIWHDMMFACAMYPVFDEFLQSVREEVRQNAQRISRHPSIAVWATNNENEAAIAGNWYGTSRNIDRFSAEYVELYVQNVLDVLKQNVNDELLVSSPSNGVKSVEDGYISKNPQDNNYGDIHFYNYIFDGTNPNNYPKPRFASEYGFQSLPKMTSWRRTMAKEDDLMELINHRQHFPFKNLPIEVAINNNFIYPKNDSDAFIYLSQISQALITKTETEVYRSQRSTEHRTMGALYWQLNDVWVAPSWSSIDFYGNFKVLHNWAQDFMAPVTVIAHRDASDDNVNIYISRDTMEAELLDVNITANIYVWSKLLPESTVTISASVEPCTTMLAKTLKIDELLSGMHNRTNSFIEFRLEKGKETISSTFFFPKPIKEAVGISDPKIQVRLDDNFFCQQGAAIVNIVVTVQKPAVFVYLELLREDVEQVRFTKNGYMQTEPTTIITLEYTDKSCKEIEASNIKVLTVNQFMV